MVDYEFYETPDPLTAWLFREIGIEGICYEPCAGSGAIVRAAYARGTFDNDRRMWVANDLDPRWIADTHADAAQRGTWDAMWPGHPDVPDWTVTNPPFSKWREIAELALERSRVGVALYLRLSALESPKGPRGKRDDLVAARVAARRWWLERPPNAVLICPRFGHQRSPDTGKWATDSVTCCWVVWDGRRNLLGGRNDQRIVHAPEDVLAALDAYTPTHRARMDTLMAHRVTQGAHA